MLTVRGTAQELCSGFTRRDAIRAAGMGLFGTNLLQLLAAEEAGQTNRARAKSVIFLFLFGGPSQLETFDMKPNAPAEIRGPFRSITSRTDGLNISEHLPRLATLSDRYSVIRTVTHQQNDHNACHIIQTGHEMPVAERGPARVNATEKDWPAIGSVISYLDRQGINSNSGLDRKDFPGFVYLPNRLGHIQGYDRSGQYAGWLGKSFDPLATRIEKRNTTDNPYFRNCVDEELKFQIDGLLPQGNVTLDRLNGRLSLLEQFDLQRRELERSRSVLNYRRVQSQAFDLMTSDKMRKAFDIGSEPPSQRDRYGRHLFGQSVLMGRRMIEAGARFVTVLWDCPDGYSWDSHVHSNDVKQYLLPGLDVSLSALIEDLTVRGMLDETLIVCMGEMGRTPQANSNWGRNHWSYCFPAILAGGGIQGGAVYGKSDKDAAYPIEKPVSPMDLAATIYHSLAIPLSSRLFDPLGRPVPILDHGTPIEELFS